MTWKTVTLGETVELLAGFSFKSAHFTDEPNAISLLRGDNIAQGATRWDGAKRWSSSAIEGLEKYWLRKDDVVLAMDRPWIDAGLKFAPVKESDLPALLVQRVARLRAGPPLNQIFLRYIIGAKQFTDHVKAITTGANVPHISGHDIRAYSYLLPPIQTQRRIADILSAYDDLIENNTRRIAILQDLARRLFEEWFIRFRFPGGRGDMPDDWTYGKFGDVANLRKAKTSPGEHLSGRHYVPIECIGRKSLALPERRPWQEAQSSLQTFERGDILFGAMRAYFHKVCVAPFAGITRSTCFVLTPKIPERHSFVTLLAFREETVAYASAHSKGSTIPYAQWQGSLEDMAIVIPNDRILADFQRIVDPIIETIIAMHETQHNLRTTRDLLLPRLISGEIEVRTAEENLEAAAA